MGWKRQYQKNYGYIFNAEIEKYKPINKILFCAGNLQFYIKKDNVEKTMYITGKNKFIFELPLYSGQRGA